MDTNKMKNEVLHGEFESIMQRLLRKESACRSEITELPKGYLVKKTMHGSESVALQFMENGKKRFVYLQEEEVDAYEQALERRKKLLKSLKEITICIRHLRALFLRAGWPLPPEAAEIAGRSKAYYSTMPYRQDFPRLEPEDWLASLPIIQNLPPYHPEGRRYHTEGGDMVRSKFEVIVANLLYWYKIEYRYELTLSIDGRMVCPDFVVRSPADGRPTILECVGKLDDPKYRQDWRQKLESYAAAGFLEGDNLIVIYDHPQRGFDSARLSNILRERWGGSFSLPY